MALDATVGGENANSYCTVVEADAYHTTILNTSTWDNAGATDKEKALMMATRLLDNMVDWDGVVVTVEQALRWPRSGAYTPDDVILPPDEVPDWLKDATAEFARWLLDSDRMAERTYGMSKVKAGPVEVMLDKGDPTPIMPPAVASMIQGYGTVSGTADGVNVPLERV